MSVIVKGLKMPKGDPVTINIYRDGSWVNAYTTEDGKVIEVPTPHGDLIDRDALKQKKRHSNEFAENVVSVAEIDWMPTIIEAEGT